MKSQKGISLIMLIILIVVIFFIVVFIIAGNHSKKETYIEWGYMPSTEYYELRLAATTSEVSGSGKGTLSLASFNTLGKDVKKAKGKWFKNSNVNFKTKILDADDTETVTLTDGEHVAMFRFYNGENFVHYYFYDEDDLQYNLKEFNLLGGYRITIK